MGSFLVVKGMSQYSSISHNTMAILMKYSLEVICS